MDAKWGWLGLLVVAYLFAAAAWRNQTLKPIPPVILLLQVALLVGIGGYTAYRFVA
jgi:flagellar biosynthesis protein FliQ